MAQWFVEVESTLSDEDVVVRTGRAVFAYDAVTWFPRVKLTPSATISPGMHTVVRIGNECKRPIEFIYQVGALFEVIDAIRTDVGTEQSCNQIDANLHRTGPVGRAGNGLGCFRTEVAVERSQRAARALVGRSKHLQGSNRSAGPSLPSWCFQVIARNEAAHAVGDEVDLRRLAYLFPKVFDEVLQVPGRLCNAVIRVVLEALHARVAEGDAE
jgi:hypothetical protein